jgi:hypothetical protein
MTGIRLCNSEIRSFAGQVMIVHVSITSPVAVRAGRIPNAGRRATRTSEVWSYSAGERGRNRVRAYQRVARGTQAGNILLQFSDLAADGTRRKRRVSIGRCSRDVAKAKADALAGTRCGARSQRSSNTYHWSI